MIYFHDKIIEQTYNNVNQLNNYDVNIVKITTFQIVLTTH